MVKIAPSIDYAPQGGTLKLFHESDAYCRCLVGPLGSGKTHAMIVELLLQILEQAPDNNRIRRSRIAAVRNSWPDLKNTVIADFNEIIGATGLGTLKMTAPAEWSAQFPVGDGTTVEAEILFLAFDDPSDQRKARGLQLSGLWCNEAAELAKENVDLLMNRVGRYPERTAVPKAKRFVIMDTNSCARDHWLAKLALDNTPESWKVFMQPGAVRKADGRWRVNPLAENIQNLPRDYYDIQLQGKSDQWIRRNLANEFVYLADGRPVHPDFTEHLHVREVALDPSLPLFVGIDFARTPAAAFGQKLPSGRWIVTHELVTENMSALRFGEMMKRFIAEHEELNNCSSYVFTGDPAGEQQAQTRDETCFQVLDTVGIHAQPAHTNDFGVRVNSLDQLLTQIIDKEPAFQVHPRCKALIRGLAGGYHYRRMKVPGDERHADRPDKGMHSHVVESCHYLLMATGEDILSFSKEWEAANEEC